MDQRLAIIQTIADAREFALSTVCDYQFGGTASAEGFAKWIYANRNVMDFNNYDNDLAEYLVSEGENPDEYDDLRQTITMQGWFRSHPLTHRGQCAYRAWQPEDEKKFADLYSSDDYKNLLKKTIAPYEKNNWLVDCPDILQYNNKQQWFACDSYYANELTIECYNNNYYIPVLPCKIVVPDEGGSSIIMVKIDSNGKLVDITESRRRWIYRSELQQSPEKIASTTLEMLTNGSLNLY